MRLMDNEMFTSSIEKIEELLEALMGNTGEG